MPAAGRYLHLLLAWTRREFGVRYTQTLLGSLWSIVQPLGLTMAFTFLFRGVTRIDVPVPYVIYAYLGVTLWTMLSGGLTMASSSLSASLNVAGKVSYPRSVAAVAGCLLAVMDLLIALALFPLVVLTQGGSMHLHPMEALGALLGCLAFSVGLGLFVSALTVFVRDVRSALPFVLQVGVLVSPIGYPVSHLPATLRAISDWNPITTYVIAFRSAFVDVSAPAASDWLRSLSVTALVLALGAAYFAKVQSRFTDVA